MIDFETRYRSKIIRGYEKDGKDSLFRDTIFVMSDKEYDRISREKKFPILSEYGELLWLNEDGYIHRMEGPALVNSSGVEHYYIDGIEMARNEWKKHIHTPKPVYFLREKIITLQKLLEIPELYDEVYYAHKSTFISLLRKI